MLEITFDRGAESGDKTGAGGGKGAKASASTGAGSGNNLLVEGVWLKFRILDILLMEVRMGGRVCFCLCLGVGSGCVSLF